MTKRLGLNLGLVLAIIALAAVIYLEPGAKETGPEVLMSLPVSEVKTIQLQRGDAPPIRIERLDNGWMVVAPIRIPASDFRVEGLLKLMAATSHGHFPATLRPLSTFGLEVPLGSVVFNDQSILFGTDEPLNRRRYVLVDDQVHLINEYHFYKSQLLLTALVDTALLAEGQVLKKISLPGLLLQLEATDWQIVQESLAASSGISSMDDINAMVDEWQHVRASQVSSYRKDVAEGIIELGFDDGETMVLEILSREPDLIIGRRELGLRYHFSADQRDRMLTITRPEPDLDSGSEAVVDAVTVAE